MHARILPSLLLAFAISSITVDVATTQPDPVRFVEITSPRPFAFTPADVPPVWTYEWKTVDGNEDPAEVRFVLLSTRIFNNSYSQTIAYLRGNPDAPEWSPWTAYLPPDVGTAWTSPPMDYGQYVFAVQGRDANGVVEPLLEEPRNVRRVKIQQRDTGPTLTVTGELISPIVATTTDTPVTETSTDGGVLVSFCWTAEAEHYGGTVTGYRYQWDIIDPDDEAQGETGFIPFPEPEVCSVLATFVTGDHTFTIEIQDNSGYKSRVPILVQFVTPNGVAVSTWGGVKALYAAE
jgi:hypothetical protein